MANGVNKVIIVGFVGADPEVRSLPSESRVANMRVAVTRKFKNQSGELQEETEWVSVVSFGGLAETVAKYVTKGKQVYVEGRLHTSSWDDKESGQKRYKTEVVASEVVFLSGGSRSETSESSSDELPF